MNLPLRLTACCGQIAVASASLQDGKTYPLCPLCYNYPPFEGVTKVRWLLPVLCAWW
jgi:hypothetical protein